MKKTLMLITLIITLGLGVFTASALTPINHTNYPAQVTVTATLLNVRSGPGAWFPKVGEAYKGQRLTCFGKINNWYIVHLENDVIGLVSGNFAEPWYQPTTPGQPPVSTPTPTTPPILTPFPTPTISYPPATAKPQGSAQPSPPTQPSTPVPPTITFGPPTATPQTATPTATPQTATQPPATTATPSGDTMSSLEKAMFDMVNKERSNNGLALYSFNMDVVKVARVKAKDMVDNNYFSHQSPTYGSPFDMLKSFGISYRSAGENLAQHGTVTNAHNALMNSSGHRANILSQSFDQIGIGVVEGPGSNKTFVQLFIKQ